MKNSSYNLIELLHLLFSQKKKILLIFFTSIFCSVLFSLFIPKWYQSETTIFPPEKEDMGFGFGGVGELAGALLGSGGGYDLPMFATASDLYVTILKSRTMAIHIIDKFKLKILYKSKSLETTIRILKRHTEIESNKDGTITIRFIAKKDPVLAAEVVKSYVTELDSINQQIRKRKAANIIESTQGQRIIINGELEKAENQLLSFQKNNHSISLPDETAAALNGMAELIAQRMALQIQLGSIRRTVGKNISEINNLNAQIDEIDNTLKIIQYGNVQNRKSSSIPMFSLANAPKLLLEYAGLYRQVKVYETLSQILEQQYQQAKINEMRSTPTINVLDEAMPADRKIKPKRAIIVIMGVLLINMASIVIILIQDYIKRLRLTSPEEYRKIEEMMGSLKIKV
jgi:tyrosine-protein kinase Etk/Wzc